MQIKRSRTRIVEELTIVLQRQSVLWHTQHVLDVHFSIVFFSFLLYKMQFPLSIAIVGTVGLGIFSVLVIALQRESSDFRRAVFDFVLFW